MRPTTNHSPLLLLLLPSLITAVVAHEPSSQIDSGSDHVAALQHRDAIGTRNAPVDGQDGMPHRGPFVERDHPDHDLSGLPPLEGKPVDALAGLPETNDGVMGDPDRPKPKAGTTGTEGGVSEKDEERNALKDATGAAADKVPEGPHSVPSAPSSNAEQAHPTVDDVTGLGKPADLPDKIRDDSQPVPDSANKDHLEVGGSKNLEDLEKSGEEGLIQPFHSYILSLTMILVSEVGDKTFLVAALMAMKHDRMVVFSAAFSALLVMTVLSAVLGHAVPTLIPKRLTSFAAAILFFVFGGKLLLEGMAMDPNEGVTEELHEVERELAEKEKETGRHRGNSNAVSPHALEMGLGDEGRKGRSQTRFPSPPRSPSSSPSRSRSRGRYASVTGLLSGLNNLSTLLLSPAWVQTFVMTFLGEWGDRSQIATIAMAAGDDYWWVTIGAMTGHAVCTGVAVVGGRAIAGKVSLKVVTVGGAVAFLIFGFIYFIEALYA